MLTERFEEALVYAARLHKDQLRKASPIPYVSHLLAVASIVLEHGGDEDEAIAALLHDAIEDVPRDGRTAHEIGERFGPDVLAIVRHCTKAEIDEHGPADEVRERRRRQAADYVAHLATAEAPVKLVAAADKLHNARSIVADLRAHGDAVWRRFNKSREEAIGYYADLAVALRGGDHRSEPLVDELSRTVNTIRELAGVPAPARGS